MMLLILLAIAIGSGKVNRAEVDLIELNHMHSDNGCPLFDQVILWKWSPDYRRYHAKHWFIPHDPTQYPVEVGDRHQCLGSDQKTIYRAKLFRETWTTVDPERENLKLLPLEMRKTL